MRSLYLPEGTPTMERYFNIGRIGDAERLNRVFTLEYLSRKMGVETD